MLSDHKSTSSPRKVGSVKCNFCDATILEQIEEHICYINNQRIEYRANIQKYQLLNINTDYMKGISNLDPTQLAMMAANDKVIVPGKPVTTLSKALYQTSTFF